jgi:streptogramin lyase
MGRIVGFATLVAVLLLSAAGSAWAAPGDVYLGDSSNGKVFRVPAGGGSAQLISSDPDFVSPNSLEFAPDGRLFVLDYGNSPGPGALLVLDPATGQATPFVSGPPFEQPDGMALAPDGSMYVTDVSVPAIFRVDLKTAAVSTVTSGGMLAGGTLGIAVEPSTGRIFVTDGSNDRILAVDPHTGAQSVFSTGDPSDSTGGLAGLTRLPGGTLGAVDYYNDKVFRVDGATGLATLIANDPSLGQGSYDMTHDLDGNLIDAGGNNAAAALRFDPQTGSESTVALNPSGSYIEGVMVEPPRCGGKIATIPGTTKSETINASPFPDVIAGLSGKDVVNGLGGDDLVCAGSGGDTVNGGPGKDTLIGEGGKDTLRGGKGNDTLKGGKGKDRLVGGPGRDTLSCGGGKRDVAVADPNDRVRRSCEKVK